MKFFRWLFGSSAKPQDDGKDLAREVLLDAAAAIDRLDQINSDDAMFRKHVRGLAGDWRRLVAEVGARGY